MPAPLPDYLRIPIGRRYRYIALDMASDDFGIAVRDFRPTKVVHLAGALRATPGSPGIQDYIFQNNVQSTASLLDAILQCEIEMLLLASTGGVYGKQDQFPIKETATPAPLDIYSRSKLACEDLVRQFAFRSGVPTSEVRIFNVLGPGQDDLHFAGRVASQMASILVSKTDSSIRIGSLTSSRDFLDARDVCYGLDVILKSNLHGIYNLGSGFETNISELLRFFLEAARLRKDICIDIDQDADWIDPVPRHVANISRLTSKGFAPQYSLELSCREMLDYCVGCVLRS